MTFEESKPLAKQLAEQELMKGFDVEAFLILCELERMGDNVSEDIIPDSTVDESIQRLLNLFVSYYNNMSVDTLKPLLDTLEQIISEIYHISETPQEKEAIKSFIQNTWNTVNA